MTLEKDLSEKDLIEIINKISIETSITDLMDEQLDEIPDENIISVGDGTAWVKEGQVFVNDPLDNGRKAAITPGEGVMLYVNGILRSNRVQVDSNDIIEVRIANNVIAGSCSLEFIEDKLEAFIVVEPTRVQSYKLLEQKPKHKLHLKTVLQEKLECPFDLEQLNKMLAEANVVIGVDLNAVLPLIIQPAPAKIIVAKGIPADLPVDEEVEILFKQDMELISNINNNDRIDYHNIKKILCVEENDVRRCQLVVGFFCLRSTSLNN